MCWYETVLGIKLGGVAEYLIDGSEKHTCRLSFEFWSPHVIERRSKLLLVYNSGLKVVLEGESIVLGHVCDINNNKLPLHGWFFRPKFNRC